MEQDSDNSGTMMTVGLVFFLGAVVGAGIGLLLAPRAGSETRAMLIEKAREAREKTAEAAEMVREKASMMHRPGGHAHSSEA
jgi:gas vesicle protein